MFVSSYGTYIQTDTSSRDEKRRVGDAKSEASFNSKLSEQPKLKLSSFADFPVDYVWNEKLSKNKFEIEKQTQKLQDFENTEFNKQEKLTKEFHTKQTLENAKIAYNDNSKLFSQLRKPKTTIDQTPKIDSNLPQNIQELKEQNMRRVMVNTYIKNDNYYKLTA